MSAYLISTIEVKDPAEVGARDRAKNHPAIEIEHIGRTKEQCGRRKDAFERVDLERAEQDQELTDKPACARQPNGRQGEDHKDERVRGHSIDEPAEAGNLVRV